MLRDDDAPAWITLSRAPGLNAAVVSRALGILGSATAIVTAPDSTLQHARLPARARRYLLSTAAPPRAAERAWLRSSRHRLVPFTDQRFPDSLRRARRCPLALYVVGRDDALAGANLSIVGSRNPTLAGRDTAFLFARSLAQSGLGITSGLAEGIDAAAHLGALSGQGITMAVLGNGVDVVYPRCNRELSHEISVHGALLSEFPLGTPPRAKNFPRRNAIIATLGLGTLVVEAALGSGSLITARLAADNGRVVFAVPGSVYNPLSRGCHELIRGGAKLTVSTADILRQLKISDLWARPHTATEGVSTPPGIAAGMDKDHKILLDALGFDPATLDALVVRTGFKPDAVSSMMLILELEGHVQAAPGGCYSRVVRSRSER